METIEVRLWGTSIGALSWDEGRRVGSFQYTEAARQSNWEISPLLMPLSPAVYHFPELADTRTFKGLPGVIADSLPEKFGNRLLDQYLVKHGRRLEDLNPIERLCYAGSRAMGALEYVPDLARWKSEQAIPLQVNDLVEVAKAVLSDQRSAGAHLNTRGMESLITVGTSAGGAKAKAVIAIHPTTRHVLSGQTEVPEGYQHWILKFDEIENEEHATARQIGRIEYAYSEMAYAAGITMMPCALLEDGSRKHFMSQRFDRVNGNQKVHVATLAGLTHLDRDPPGQVGYERLFQTIRDLGLGQDTLSEAYRRMVFNIICRNQDDHTRNHAFVMFGNGQWQLSPAYDICFSYKPGNQYIEQHQMACNGKRDKFNLDDLTDAAVAADVKKPKSIIAEVEAAAARWPEFADLATLDEREANVIGSLFRSFL